jgi:glycosyltransferase involved in cell wall biosynthesis
VPPADPAALAGALARVLDEPGLAARMGEEALRVGRERYTWEANARRMSAIYESLTS